MLNTLLILYKKGGKEGKRRYPPWLFLFNTLTFLPLNSIVFLHLTFPHLPSSQVLDVLSHGQPWDGWLSGEKGLEQVEDDTRQHIIEGWLTWYLFQVPKWDQKKKISSKGSWGKVFTKTVGSSVLWRNGRILISGDTEESKYIRGYITKGTESEKHQAHWWNKKN